MLMGVVYYFSPTLFYILPPFCSSISWCLQLFIVFPKMLSHQQKMKVPVILNTINYFGGSLRGI